MPVYKTCEFCYTENSLRVLWLSMDRKDVYPAMHLKTSAHLCKLWWRQEMAMTIFKLALQCYLPDFSEILPDLAQLAFLHVPLVREK